MTQKLSNEVQGVIHALIEKGPRRDCIVDVDVRRLNADLKLAADLNRPVRVRGLWDEDGKILVVCGNRRFQQLSVLVNVRKIAQKASVCNG